MAVLVTSFLAAGARDEATPSTRPATAFTPIDTPHLHNAHRVTPSVLSGAQPESEASFKTLADLGVRTIISVDGARPDVAGAARHGISYVHLPIGYDGVSEQEGMTIAKAIRELPGPFYIHCHHGKHRSAGAVAVACVYSGALQPTQAEAVLRTFGTGENYTGLWKAARDARPRDPRQLKDLKVEFVPAAKIPPLAEAMVTIDHRWEHLQSIQKNNWQAPQDHPDLDPAHEALQLQEHYQELARTNEIKARPADFRGMLGESLQASDALRQALAAKPLNAAAADAACQRIAASCAACHRAYRD